MWILHWSFWWIIKNLGKTQQFLEKIFWTPKMQNCIIGMGTTLPYLTRGNFDLDRDSIDEVWTICPLIVLSPHAKLRKSFQIYSEFFLKGFQLFIQDIKDQMQVNRLTKLSELYYNKLGLFSYFLNEWILHKGLNMDSAYIFLMTEKRESIYLIIQLYFIATSFNAVLTSRFWYTFSWKKKKIVLTE